MGTPPRSRQLSSAEDWTVLLVANYRPDGQRSMQRFTDMLAAGLMELGVTVRIYYPPVVFGNLGARPKGLGKWIGYLDKYLVAPLHLRWRARRMSGRVVAHIIDHSNAPYVSSLAKTPHLVTCHDLLAVRSALGELKQNQPGFTGRCQQAMILRGLKRSQHIVSVSGATAEDVRRLVGDEARRTSVIPNAIEPVFEHAAAGRELRCPPLREIVSLPAGASYVFHIGGEKWYKNRIGVLQIFAKLADEHPDLHLLAVGPAFSEAQLQSSGCLDLRKRIQVVQGVSDLALIRLYQSAELLLFPSWIEGFGWPIVEAQACGCPVLTLDVAPMNELNASDDLIGSADADTGNWVFDAAKRASRYIGMDPEERRALGAKLQAFALDFKNANSAQAYRTLYLDILKTSSRPS